MLGRPKYTHTVINVQTYHDIAWDCIYFVTLWKIDLRQISTKSLCQTATNIWDQNSVLFSDFSRLGGEVCVTWLKSGKVWWCNTIWGRVLHTLFLSVPPLRPSMRLCFLPVLLLCLQTLTKQKKTITDFGLNIYLFLWVAYAMSAT